MSSEQQISSQAHRVPNTSGIEQSASRPRLVGEVLIAEGHLTHDQLEQTLIEQRTSGKKIGELLVSSGIVSESVLLHSLARCLGVKGVRLRHGLIDPQLLSLLSAEECERLKILPMFRVHNRLTVANAIPALLASSLWLILSPSSTSSRNLVTIV